MGKRILIIEDNKEINGLLSSFLLENEYETSQAFDGIEASAMLSNDTYDLVLMDLMLPYKGGDALIKELREHSNTPVIVLSAKSMMETRLEVLRLGADDYIMKPFDLDEVLVRMEVVLRRCKDCSAQNEVSLKQDILSVGLLEFREDKHQVTYDGKNVTLTAKEMLILKQLMKNPDTTFSKADLYELVWKDTYYCEDNTINVHVSNLRNKLKKATGKDFIDTVWGIGYRLKQE
ncbi:MAG: response regulator transcription factor [Lachnospiraceae bacterium]